ncbi:CLUMA_CG007615, isoform A [Clunio marinus]|uniref:CLUMA_CG007615, isoform A n=1 Tax=Clunio marinus TaxID=568069 RepID=A0A1J1I3C4_9DIPT|nr:CLUMA_CG007615, isoform A [Clunio marinus]
MKNNTTIKIYRNVGGASQGIKSKHVAVEIIKSVLSNNNYLHVGIAMNLKKLHIRFVLNCHRQRRCKSEYETSLSTDIY